MIPYHWQYLPLLMQILFAIGLAAMMVLASWFVGQQEYSREAGCLKCPD